MPRRVLIAAILVLSVRAVAPAAGHVPSAAELQAAKAQGGDWKAFLLRLESAYPYAADWLAQDAAPQDAAAWLAGKTQALFVPLCRKLASRVEPMPAELAARVAALASRADEEAACRLYFELCRRRRGLRLKPLLERTSRIVFTKFDDHASQGYSLVATGGRSLCLLEMHEGYARVTELLAGQVRDPDVDFDARRVLFSCNTGSKPREFSLHEMDLASRVVRRVTTENDVADIQGAYLGDGGIVFNSSRCVQECDCISYTAFNLYRCERDGSRLRRLGFDQVSVSYPRVMDDGRVIYTRWEYNDRGQIYPQPLFQMNPDGTAQTEYYGNNSYFPTSLHHARPIPGTDKAVAIASGHHTPQSGKLAVVDPARGRQEDTGVELLAPPRRPQAVRVDRWGQDGDQFQYPYALSEEHFLVALCPEPFLPAARGRGVRYRLYLIDRDGRRELLATDPAISCNQPVPVMPRSRPAVRMSGVDLGRKDGTFYVQNVYAGPGLAGVACGAAKTLRVVAIEYRRTSIGCSLNTGPAGGNWHVRTPVSITGSWDVKRVLGQVPIHSDGSAYFKAPANTPVFFQVLDARGHCIQTMRSWATLMPGENASCVGCHEDKGSAPAGRQGTTMALRAGAEELTGFYGPPRGFSFAREIQPILDRHCVKCHSGRRWQPAENKELTGKILAYPGKGMYEDILAMNARSAVTPTRNPDEKPFSLRGDLVSEHLAARKWSDAYVGLLRPFLFPPNVIKRPGGYDKHILVALPNRLVNWVSPQSEPSMLQPYHAGACRSGLIAMLARGHNKVVLSPEEMDKIACWIDLQVPFCGDYLEAHDWTEAELAKWRAEEDKARRIAKAEAAAPATEQAGQ